jgi:D-beta-D-heptose 7-phosphate kinase/D-beta-D-heptose 1-phosphate adenosyltransferase
MPSSFSQTRFSHITQSFSQKAIVVIGDMMLDEYWWGSVNRISPEAPVPVVALNGTTCKLGGAANVALNLKMLGMEPLLVGVHGEDANGQTLRTLLAQQGISDAALWASNDRPTTTKTRIVAQNQQVVRADRESTDHLPPREREHFLATLPALFDRAAGVIISDYGKGVLDEHSLSHILQQCRERNLFVAIDPTMRNAPYYGGAGLITPNLKEAQEALGVSVRSRSEEEVQQLGWELLERSCATLLLITLGERGMALFDSRDRSFFHLPTVAQKVFDVTGAGDTVISMFSAALSGGATAQEAAYLANHAAGLSVAQLGTAAIGVEELRGACLG